MAHELRIRVAIPLTGDAKVAAAMEQAYERAASRAAVNVANEGVAAAPNRTPDWLSARN